MLTSEWNTKENKGTAQKEQNNVSYHRYSVMEVPWLEREMDFPIIFFIFQKQSILHHMLNGSITRWLLCKIDWGNCSRRQEIKIDKLLGSQLRVPSPPRKAQKTQEDRPSHNSSLRTKESSKSQIQRTVRDGVWVGDSEELQELGLVSQLWKKQMKPLSISGSCWRKGCY